MAATNTSVAVATATWTEITTADSTSVTFQNQTRAGLWVKATTGSAPSDLLGAIFYGPGEGEANRAIADMFPGVTSANRVWVYAEDGGRVMISHT